MKENEIESETESKTDDPLWAKFSGTKSDRQMFMPKLGTMALSL